MIYLTPASNSLSEVVVVNHKERESTLNTTTIGKNFIFENNTANLAKTLSKLPGMSTMDIGSGVSKPVIRGLGFNRVAVVDQGITQQGQQWGADHGLEIDQYNIDEVVVHKGSASLQFGSDAMGGAIEIMPAKAPSENIYMGDALLMGKSNNDLAGISLMNAFKHNRWFFKARYTNQRYSDYRVPGDSLTYMNTRFPIYNGRLKNTAGKEEDVSVLIQYASIGFENNLNVTNVYQKNGFFPGSHGIPNLNGLQHDGSYRNIDMPYNSVNHFKVINNMQLRLNDNLKWVTDLGYQDNHRQEMSYFHSHFPNQVAPQKDPNLELDFKLQTYTINTKAIVEHRHFVYTFGMQSSYQQNRIGGYNFFLPQYNQFTMAGYGIVDYHLNDKLSFIGGMRYDYGTMSITGYYDEQLAAYLKQMGYSQSRIDENAQRAYDAKPHFGNFSGSLGVIACLDQDQSLKINIGKSFRLPTVNELASNGIHHGAFRHEQGDPNLKPEQGYQLDIDYTIHKGIFTLSLSPFVSYYNNYIFIEPSGTFSALPDAGQLYKYKEAEAFFAGGEYQIRAAIFHHFDLYSSGQYVYNRNETDKYPLPMTPPFSMRNEITYTNKYRYIQSYKIGLEHQYFAKQSRISRNEQETESATIFNFSTNASFKIDKFRFTLGFQIQNIFDTEYYNHISFYRKLKIPEVGRNFQILLKIPFYNQL